MCIRDSFYIAINLILIKNIYSQQPKFIKERILNPIKKMDAEAESNFLFTKLI